MYIAWTSFRNDSDTSYEKSQSGLFALNITHIRCSVDGAMASVTAVYK